MSSPNLKQMLIVNGAANTTGDSFPIASSESSFAIIGTMGGASVSFELSRDNINWAAAKDRDNNVFSTTDLDQAIGFGPIAEGYNIRVVITGGSGTTSITVIRDGV